MTLTFFIYSYRICLRSKKWWWALFAWIPDMIMQNSWIMYRQQKCASDSNHDLLSFRREVVAVYFSKYASKVNKISKTPSVSKDVRFDMEGHFAQTCPTTKRCALCKKATRKWCIKCKKGLHDRCFNEFHGVV